MVSLFVSMYPSPSQQHLSTSNGLSSLARIVSTALLQLLDQLDVLLLCLVCGEALLHHLVPCLVLGLALLSMDQSPSPLFLFSLSQATNVLYIDETYLEVKHAGLLGLADVLALRYFVQS